MTQLADAIGTNFQLVPIAGFDDLFEKDLLASMTAAERCGFLHAAIGYSAVGMPADMLPLNRFPLSGFEASPLLARLGQYAERTDMCRPSAIDDTWIEQMMDRLDLVRPIGDDKVPTLAGWSLFSGNPSEQFKQARVQFHATSPAHWLKGRFGDDIDLDEAEQPGEDTVRRKSWAIYGEPARRADGPAGANKFPIPARGGNFADGKCGITPWRSRR